MAEEVKKSESKREANEARQTKLIKDFIDDAEVKSEFYMEMEISLETPLAKKLYKRSFDHVQTQATAATLLTRKFGLRELSDENVKKIDESLKQLNDELSNDMAFADSIIEDTGMKMSATTPDRVDLVAKITCPQGMAMMKLITKLDLLAMKLKTLWMAGELSLANSEDRSYQWQARIFKASDAIRALGTEAYIAAEKKKQSDIDKAQKKREKQAKRRAERQAQAVNAE